MSYGDVIGVIKCYCGKSMAIKEGKAGTLSGHCAPNSGGCGKIVWFKTPASIAAFKARAERSELDPRRLRSQVL